jgi:hypothetical protein
MPRNPDADLAREDEAIESYIRQNPGGVSIHELLSALDGLIGRQLTRRTLQRRLNRLIEEGRIRSAGAARATRYYPSDADAGAEPAPATNVSEDYIPLSRGGEEVRAFIRQPLGARPPVGYEPGFLECYEPGVTWYLSPELREHLHLIGQTPDPQRPAGTYAREIYEQLLFDLSWSSSRLEGNTYTRLDTKELLRYGRAPEGKDLVETQMILNHRAAIEMLVEQAEEVGFDRPTFLALHAALSENLVRDRRNEGALRTRLVQITHSKFTPLAIPQKIEEHFHLLLAKASRIPDPFEQSFFVMVHLPYLQPFIDVNKRTSRLGANIPLIKANLCPLSFVDVPERAYLEGTLGVYEMRRVDLLRDIFVWAYERSCAQYIVVRDAVGQPDPFRLAYRDTLREVVRDIVQLGALPEPAVLREWAVEHALPAEDVDAFVDTARGELLDLHEGSFQRYRLRPSEFQAWVARIR